MLLPPLAPSPHHATIVNATASVMSLPYRESPALVQANDYPASGKSDCVRDHEHRGGPRRALSPAKHGCGTDDVPSWLGYSPASMRTVIVLPSTDQVPKLAVVAFTAAVFSSGVPWMRLFALNFSRPD